MFCFLVFFNRKKISILFGRSSVGLFVQPTSKLPFGSSSPTSANSSCWSSRLCTCPQWWTNEEGAQQRTKLCCQSGSFCSSRSPRKNTGHKFSRGQLPNHWWCLQASSNGSEKLCLSGGEGSFTKSKEYMSSYICQDRFGLSHSVLDMSAVEMFVFSPI